MEKLVVDAETGEAAPFSRIETLLENLERSGDWRGMREEGRLIALIGETLLHHPGARRPARALGPALSGHPLLPAPTSSPTSRGSSPRPNRWACAFWGWGSSLSPPWSRSTGSPRPGTGSWDPTCQRTGDMGQRMMKQTAGLQVNLDYADEADCIDKLRLGLVHRPPALRPFRQFAADGGSAHGLSFHPGRHLVPHRPRPHRPASPTSFGKGPATPTTWNTPSTSPCTSSSGRAASSTFTRERVTFRRYLAEGYQGLRATLGDWDLHLSTLFPEVRLRPQIEIRPRRQPAAAADPGVAALVKGLLYDGTARREAGQLFGTLRTDDRQGTPSIATPGAWASKRPSEGAPCGRCALDAPRHLARGGLRPTARKKTAGAGRIGLPGRDRGDRPKRRRPSRSGSSRGGGVPGPKNWPCSWSTAVFGPPHTSVPIG